MELVNIDTLKIGSRLSVSVMTENRLYQAQKEARSKFMMEKIKLLSEKSQPAQISLT